MPGRCCRSSSILSPAASAQSITPGAIQIFIGVSVNAFVTFAAGSIALFLGTRPTWLLVQRWLMGTVLAALAVKLAMEKRA